MRQIIILDVEPSGNNESTIVAAFWFPRTVSASRPVFARKVSSAVPNVTKSELEALISGAVVERVVRTGSVASGDLASVPTMLQDMYAVESALVNAQQATNIHIGREWDGATWSPPRGTFEPPPRDAEPAKVKAEFSSPDVVDALGKLGAKLDDLIELTGERR